MDKRERFLRIYANLPMALRNQVIYVLQNKEPKEPMTWNAVFVEVHNNTALGKLILEKLDELGFI